PTPAPFPYTTLFRSLAEEPTERIPRVQARRLDRCEQVALIAAWQAWADAGFELPSDEREDVEPERLGVSIGTGIGGPMTLLNQRSEEHTSELQSREN